MNFASNSTVDDQGYPLPDFPVLMEYKLWDLTILAWEVFWLIKNLDCNKTTGLDKIAVVVLKNLSLELSSVLAKLFYCYLKKKCHLSLWKLSALCLIFKNADEHSSPLQYCLISLLSVISKFFESIINKEIAEHLTRNSLLSNKQYGFCYFRTIADVLTAISHRSSEA